MWHPPKPTYTFQVKTPSRSIAIITMLCGIAMFVGSCVPLGLSAYRFFAAEPAHTLTLQAGESFRSSPLIIMPDKLARIEVKANINSQSVQEKMGGVYETRYRFDFRYRVFDAAGKQVAFEESAMAWNDTRQKVVIGEKTTSKSGSLVAQHKFEKFKVPSTGPVVIEARFEPDRQYGATAEQIKLLVFHGQVEETWPMITGLVMLPLGGLLVIVGLIFFTSSTAADAAGAAESPGANDRARQPAVISHLSGFLGYLIPFGHIFGALAAWLYWRNVDAYVEEHAREALNFQLSITIHMLASVILMLLLVGFFLIFVVAIFHFVMMIIAAASASGGKPFRYPATIRMVKVKSRA